LPEAAIDDVVSARVRGNDATLTQRFSEIGDWPVAAELAVHLLAWASGPHFRFPRFEQHLRKREFAIYAETPNGRLLVGGAAVECKIKEEGNPGVHPRNVAMRALFEEAEAVIGMGLDPDALFYPDPVVGELEDRTVPVSVRPPDAEETAPHAPPPEDTLKGLGAQNPDVINEAVKQYQEEADKKRSDES
jgi:hypothetical protein